jgi:broad specificity phosphatase PhoE
VSTFYLIRHAEKAAPAEILCGRTANIHLSEIGRRQAARLAQQLAREAIEGIYCSPLERARETAQPLADAKALPVHVTDHFNEVDYGHWTNQTLAALRRDEQWNRFNTFRIGTRIPGGETMLSIQCRVVSELLRLRDAFPQAEIAIVSHGDPIRAALLYFSGASLEQWNHFEVSVGSISALALSEHQARLLYMNRVPGS